MQLAELVFRLTEGFPKREWYGLASEMRRSAVSIPSNLAEGHVQGSRAFIRHVVIAVGSHAELSSQCELAFRLGYVNDANRRALEDLIGHTGRVTQGLLNALRRRLARSPTVAARPPIPLIPDPLIPDP